MDNLLGNPTPLEFNEQGTIPVILMLETSRAPSATGAAPTATKSETKRRRDFKVMVMLERDMLL